MSSPDQIARSDGLSERMAWELLDVAPNPTWIVDGSGVLLWFNEAAHAYLGSTCETGRSLFDVLPPEKAQHRRLMLANIRRSSEPVSFVDRDGGWWEVVVRPTGQPDTYLFWQRDVTRRVEAEEDLKIAVTRLATIQEDERRRISRDLHDEVGQQITVLLLELREAAEMTDPEQLKEQIKQATETAAELMRQMRWVFYELNPPLLRSAPLDQTMGEHTANFARRTGIDVVFESDGRLPELGDAEATTLFRLLQEGLNNIARHAGTARAWVSLLWRDGEVTLIVEDDGEGFDPHSATRGSGLLGLHDRFAMLEGSLDVESSGGRGTRLEGSLPVGRRPSERRSEKS